MKNIALILSIFFLLNANLTDKTDREITGKVSDLSTNKALENVIVKAKGTKISTKTNKKGIYKIKINKNTKKLIFIYPRYASKILNLTESNTLNVKLSRHVLKEDTEADDEVSHIGRAENEKSIKKGLYIKKRDYRKRREYNKVYHNTEEYDVINENEFKAVINDPLSTFSVDVDKASYSNTRRFLNQNQLPPKGAVRIEEMINYFNYDYKQPKKKDPFSVALEMGSCPWNPKHQLIHIGLQGKTLDVQKTPASNLVFLIDVSGSMSSANKLPLLKKSFEILMEKLRSKDRVAIVVYAGAAGLVLKSTSCEFKQKIINAFNKLQSGGSTAGGAGINLAYKIAKENFIKGGNNRVILATDGDFNVGQSSNSSLVSMIEEKRKDGIYLTVLGFGMGNYKDSKMEQLSNAGNGNYAYIDNILEAKKVLGKELWGTLYTIAKDVKIQIEFNPGLVKAYRLVGYENRLLNKEDFNDDKKDAGEIGAGHTVTALYEIIPASSNEKVKGVDELEYQKNKIIKSSNLMTLKLRYKKPDGDKSILIKQHVKSKNIKSKNLTNNYLFSAAVAEFGMLLRDSKFKANATFEHVINLANESKGEDKEGYRAEFVRLVKIAKLLKK